MKISRKEWLQAWLIIVLCTPFLPLIWLSEKWEHYWNDKVIEVSTKEERR